MKLLSAVCRYDRTKRRHLGGGPLDPIDQTDGWCDEPRHPLYNRPVTLPFTASHERLCRQDRLYDLIVVLDWNVWPRSRYQGSAIFLHIAPVDPNTGTYGCIALEPKHLEQVLSIADTMPGRIALKVA